MNREEFEKRLAAAHEARAAKHGDRERKLFRVHPSHFIQSRDGGYGQSDVTLFVEGYSWAGYSVGYIDAKEEGRCEHEGPLVPGPWCFAGGRCSVIDNHGGTNAEIERGAARGEPHLYARIGDVLDIDGNLFQIRPGGEARDLDDHPSASGCVHGPRCRDHIRLVPLSFEEYGRWLLAPKGN
jgi:hypothetical protein